MEHSDYLKTAKSARFKEYKFEKRCLNCGKTLEKSQSHLYFQSFCCEGCKDEYVGRDEEI